ncbi:MAG TPA: protein-methionine-sulfoxide reductase catalytic subunit MsrP [Gemmataceae bacterium]|jgi:sulfoxide reductase catalytic subunit YedY|nr:protein-methionine-sulfoxide reductase catalytic subunit MsrP [Gemmataceae bacterium]
MSQPWNLPERAATPEAVAVSRRRWLKWLGLGGLAIGAGGGWLWWRHFGGSDDDVLLRGRSLSVGDKLYPAATNPRFAEVDRPLTREVDAARFCNFYEFSSFKNVWRDVDAFKPLPWTVEVAGLVAKPRTYDMDDLVHAFPLEQRVYRHRCVEAWAMAVPWTGFPLADLLRRAEPLPGAKFVRFVSFHRPDEASHQANDSFPWPYNEGLTLAEATNELAFVATGMYGHPLLKQHGAPVRLVLPWKYGFKSAKSIVRIELTDRQPATFWNTVGPNEYDFLANVNPEIPHPRWSQARERMLGTGEARPTQLYNGYGEWVARLYAS